MIYKRECITVGSDMCSACQFLAHWSGFVQILQAAALKKKVAASHNSKHNLILVSFQ